MAQCATPVIYPSETLHTSPFNVTLTTLTQDALIYYTLDGSAPITQQQGGGEVPSDGTTSTATVLGTTYSTVVLNGKEWITKNLTYKTDSVGVWYNEAATDDGTGGYYTYLDMQQIQALLSNGWRIPLKSDFQSLIAYVEAVAPVGERYAYIKSAPFNLIPSGVRTDNGDGVVQWSGVGISDADLYGFGESATPPVGSVWCSMFSAWLDYDGEIYIIDIRAIYDESGIYYNYNMALPVRLVRDAQSSSYSVGATAQMYSGSLNLSGSSEQDGSANPSGSRTIRAVAVSDGMSASLEASTTYTFKCATPTANPSAEVQHEAFNVTLTTLTNDAKIYYTTDGSTPIVPVAPVISTTALASSWTESNANILGRSYATVVLPAQTATDGRREWLAENLAFKSSTIGRWWYELGADDGAGGYYTHAEIVELQNLLADGWRIPTYADFVDLKTLADSMSSPESAALWLAASPFNLHRYGWRTVAWVDDGPSYTQWSFRDYPDTNIVGFDNTFNQFVAVLAGLSSQDRESTFGYTSLNNGAYANEGAVSDARMAHNVRLVRDAVVTVESPGIAGSPLYTGPFELSQTTTVKAISAHAGYQNSDIMTKNYTVILPVSVTSRLHIFDFSFGVGI